MGEPEHEQHQEQKEFADGGKRKLDAFELAKQRAQEIASRIASDADQKRPRLLSENSSEPSLFSSSVSAPPLSLVGVVIGKGGETIKHIQLQSGAKIQITKDQDADPHSLTRDVELMGTSEQISRAEELICDVIAETDTGGSASSAVHGLNMKQSGAEQFAMKVPNDKVGLLIGKGGETIKYMQSRSGARMQIIPLHLPPGDTSAERTVYINGSTEQIEAAKELVNDVISGKRIINPSGSNSYAQPVYPAAGSWVQPGQPTMQQQPQYGYAQQGNQPTSSSYYGNYTQQQVWDQSNPSTMSQTPQQMTGMVTMDNNLKWDQLLLFLAIATIRHLLLPAALMIIATVSRQQAMDKTFLVRLITRTAESICNSKLWVSYCVISTRWCNFSQSSQVAPAYPPSAYTQPVANPQTYWTSSSFTGQQPPQPGYDQTGYSQTAYGGLQPGLVPPQSSLYGQGGYPLQPSPAAANYVQGTHPHAYGQPQLETQLQSQPSNNGHSQALAYGAETHDGNSKTAVQEAVPSQS
ncbi:hypothetical protein GH714_008354 [Hevea brasiliensis]|uniref:K Homology domain-containing protein n=1 Tax=Hevea brasiliensis TaxID=3981 RepID=A0A6A6M0K9_HEVBR|nr:hypothetical protein GH714_008354 [Hevea brasiliensis]